MSTEVCTTNSHSHDGSHDEVSTTRCYEPVSPSDYREEKKNEMDLNTIVSPSPSSLKTSTKGVHTSTSTLADRNANDIQELRRHLMENPGLVSAMTASNVRSQYFNPHPSKILVRSKFAGPTLSKESTTERKKTTSQSDERKIFWTCLHLMIHMILLLLFVALAASYCLRSLHKDYFVPMLLRAKRTDEDLMEEFTYYERQCSAEDITIKQEEDAWKLVYNDTDPSTSSIDQIMTHGGLVLPNVLSDPTIEQLRNFVVAKNRAVKGTEAEYPISQGFNRISYGIEATEDPAVIRALKEIHDNSKLKATLEGLVGKDPAVTEITAITAKYGSPDQEWHSDVKKDGNALQFARTYSHSYSLFMPLQDTTGDMGATDLCPGTHYCADDELYRLCEELKIGMHETVAENKGVWKAGDAALLNQQVWHRGSKHVDKFGPERIVFIVSFIARPNDTRQLSRGTYFHMKWNMWGHTWKDLGDSFVSMARPFNILRCLHIWKPENRAWGYDLITASAMRIANVQGGCEPGELPRFLHVLERAGFPSWLEGTINTKSEQAWQVYISETIDNVFRFLVAVNVVVIVASLLLSMGAAFVVQRQRKLRRGFRMVLSSLLRLVLTHSLVICTTLWLLAEIRGTEWAIGLSSGRTLQRPFPSIDTTWDDDPTVTSGRRAMPSRRDVLVGTRFDSKTIGAYSRWLDYHPANVVFREDVDTMMVGSPAYGNGWSLYHSYEVGLPPIFHQWILESILEDVEEREGRFLQQDYRTGDWRLMTRNEARAHTRLVLTCGTHGIAAEVKRGIDFLIGDYRFGLLRGTVMARRSQLFLQHMTRTLFGQMPEQSPTVGDNGKILVPILQSTVMFRPPKMLDAERQGGGATCNSKRWTTFPSVTLPHIRVGSSVLYRGPNGKTVPASVVVASNEENRFGIVFSGEIAESRGIGISNVPGQYLRKSPTMSEGLRVRANYLGEGQWFPGVVARIRPNGVDVRYDDGDYEESVPINMVVVVENN